MFDRLHEANLTVWAQFPGKSNLQIGSNSHFSSKL